MRYLNFQSSISLFLYCREHSQTLWLWKGINLNTVHEYLFHKIAENIRDSVCFTYSSQQNGNEKHTQRIGIHSLLRTLLQQRPNMKFPEGGEQTRCIMNTHSGSMFKLLSVFVQIPVSMILTETDYQRTPHLATIRGMHFPLSIPSSHSPAKALKLHKSQSRDTK